MKKVILSILYLLVITSVWSQNNVSGTFTGLANQQIKLVGYSGFKTYTIDKVKADEQGKFLLSFNKPDYGTGYLISEDGKSFMVILSEDENLELTGINFELPESIKILNGKQNLFFNQYATEHPRREQCLSAWDYLTKTYTKDSLFSAQKTPIKAIEKEKQRIKNEDSQFLSKLPQGSYVSYYLPLRKLVSSVSTIAQYRTEEFPATIQAFRQIDYTNNRLYKSGLLKEVVESHFWLIENSGRSLGSVYTEMQISIDCLLENLTADEQKQNEITEHLFKFLEQRSLFSASEYLSVKLLNEKSCTLNSDFAMQLESYRAMKKGNIAPDIVFDTDVFAPNYTDSYTPKKLTDVQSPYKVIIFGASWCPQCPTELLEISKNYATWRQQGVEVVFVSLDEDKQTFTNFIKPFSFISSCDYKKWEGQVVKDYHIFATPTIYLLNNQHEIILKPNSVSQLNTWVDWYLVKGNQ